MIRSLSKMLVVTACFAFAAGCGAKSKGKPKPLANSSRTALMTKKMPPAGTMSTMKNTVGAGSLAVTSASMGVEWNEMYDLFGTGTPTSVDFLYDATADTLYVYAGSISFPCDDGTTGMGAAILVLDKDGSGGYAGSVAAGTCGATVAATEGCQFDGAGNAGACGVCVVAGSAVTCVAATI